MNDLDARPLPRLHQSAPPAPEAVQPDPMLEDRAGPWRMAAVALAAAVVVVLVLYGVSRPPEQPQVAAAPEASQTAPAGGGAANNAGGKASPANAAAQNPQTNAQQPTTTGQGVSGGEQSGAANGHGVGKAGKPQTPPAAGGNATGTTAGPGSNPAPQAK